MQDLDQHPMLSMKSPDKCQGKRGRTFKRPHPGGEVDNKRPGCDVDDNQTSPPSTRSKRSVSISNEGARSPHPSDSTRQIRATVDTVNTAQLLDDFKSIPSFDPARSIKPPPDVGKCQSCKSIGREYPLQGIEQGRSKRKKAYCFDKFNLAVQTALSQLRDDQQVAHDIDISALKRAHEVEIDECKIAYDIEIFDLKHKQTSEIAKLKQKYHSLQEKLSVIQNETGGLQQNDPSHKIADQFTVEAEAGLEQVKRACQKYRQQIKQIESASPVLTMEQLQTNSRNEESSQKLQPKQANENDDPNAICGSYTDGVARPTRLNMDLSITRAAVAAFQELLYECYKKRRDKLWDLSNRPDVFFARPNHKSHYYKSFVNSVFFEGFEDESVNIRFGASRFQDPKRRQEMFFSYYLREQSRKQKAEDDTIDDPQFEEFCEVKAYCFVWRMFSQCKANRLGSQVSCLKQLGGPELVSTFKSAAKSVWLLHKLAFSFEPPATILTVEEGADLDPKYMESTIVQLDDDVRLVPKVGFMIDPGLLLNGEVIMQCEVYLAADPTRIPDLINKTRIPYQRRPRRQT